MSDPASGNCIVAPGKRHRHIGRRAGLIVVCDKVKAAAALFLCQETVAGNGKQCKQIQKTASGYGIHISFKQRRWGGNLQTSKTRWGSDLFTIPSCRFRLPENPSRHSLLQQNRSRMPPASCILLRDRQCPAFHRKGKDPLTRRDRIDWGSTSSRLTPPAVTSPRSTLIVEMRPIVHDLSRCTIFFLSAAVSTCPRIVGSTPAERRSGSTRRLRQPCFKESPDHFSALLLHLFVEQFVQRGEFCLRQKIEFEKHPAPLERFCGGATHLQGRRPGDSLMRNEYVIRASVRVSSLRRRPRDILRAMRLPATPWGEEDLCRSVPGPDAAEQSCARALVPMQFRRQLSPSSDRRLPRWQG